MDTEMRLNKSDSYIEIHPCHRLNVNSFVLTDNPSALCILLNFCIGLLSLITICGNLLVIISIIYFRQLHTPTNYLILSLAMADLLVGFVVFPLTIQFSISSCRVERELFCIVRSTFDMSLCTSSILNLCCISIDRYYSVCQPLTYKAKITDSVVLVMIFVSWTISAFIGIETHLLYCKENGSQPKVGGVTHLPHFAHWLLTCSYWPDIGYDWP
uniref:G-protein coupled receptors family 1 profile domain-containing protein n=1 Tax=Periophthalmus magnuspinnatus TaxID=409849 RepID=A0A3B3Z735_9GOBI